jgi:hypothetical protein
MLQKHHIAFLSFFSKIIILWTLCVRTKNFECLTQDNNAQAQDIWFNYTLFIQIVFFFFGTDEINNTCRKTNQWQQCYQIVTWRHCFFTSLLVAATQCMYSVFLSFTLYRAFYVCLHVKLGSWKSEDSLKYVAIPCYSLYKGHSEMIRSQLACRNFIVFRLNIEQC